MIFNYRSKFVALCTVLLCACATPTVVQSVKPGDNGLSCAQLQNEYADAERFRSEADKEKSVTGGNVVRALLSGQPYLALLPMRMKQWLRLIHEKYISPIK